MSLFFQGKTSDEYDSVALAITRLELGSACFMLRLDEC